MNSVDSILLLYSRSDCHLCDRAETVVMEVIGSGPWQLKKIDIDSDPKLTKRYGWSIPVLARADDGRELCWPFPSSRVRTLLL